MGRATLGALHGADEELARATLIIGVVYLYASSSDEFELEMRRVLGDSNLELVELWEAGPLPEMLDLDEDKLNAALETAKFGDPTLLVYSSDEPDDAVDPEWTAIREAAEAGDSVQFQRVGTDSWELGFAVSVGETWALVNMVDENFVTFDGYMAVRFDCLLEVETASENDTFMLAALDLRGDRPHDPQLPLDDYRSLLAALAARYPLVSLSMATARSRGWAIGRIIEVGDEAVTIQGVNTLGEWTGQHIHPYKHIEAISFGNAYNESLGVVVGPVP
jgi:hypothetical protein